VAVRPGWDPENEIYKYYLKKEHGKKTKPYPDSIISLDKKNIKNFVLWGQGMLEEIDNLGEDEIKTIPSLAGLGTAAAFAKRQDKNFWDSIMYEGCGVRARVSQEGEGGAYKFFVNHPRSSKSYEGWVGPIIEMPIGSFRSLIAAINDFEEVLNN